MKKFLSLFILTGILGFTLFQGVNIANAGWVSGYFRDDGTYVNGYYRTDPNEYKWDNYSWDGDWSDAYNDSYYDNSYDYDYGYDSYDWGW